MNLDDLIKYVVWIVFFGVALVGVYLLLTKLGVMG